MNSPKNCTCECHLNSIDWKVCVMCTSECTPQPDTEEKASFLDIFGTGNVSGYLHEEGSDPQKVWNDINAATLSFLTRDTPTSNWEAEFDQFYIGSSRARIKDWIRTKKAEWEKEAYDHGIAVGGQDYRKAEIRTAASKEAVEKIRSLKGEVDHLVVEEIARTLEDYYQDKETV